MDRKEFIKLSALGSLLPVGSGVLKESSFLQKATKPIVISTWKHGIPANEAAWEALSNGQSALDAVEAGARIPEANPEVTSVGYGGYPDREGHVTLDACIMDYNDRCGSVAFLEHIMHPISVARKVKEETPHIMLVGEGALQFAVDQGFEKMDLLTPEAYRAWQEWLKTSEYKPEINVENHDTIGILALDQQGRLSGACTTSGTAFKMHGRVGDSPIIGAGLFVDSEVGAAAATGLGEEVIRVSGSHLVVENMRRGDDPETACRKAVERVVQKNDTVQDFQIGFIALNKQGYFGGYCIHKGFNFAVYESGRNRLVDAKAFLS